MLKGNIHMVGALADQISFAMPPIPGAVMTKAEALEFAAYIVAVAEDPTKDGEFDSVLEEVRNT